MSKITVFGRFSRADYLRVDYVLRGMPVPAGNHTIEFRFEPRSYITGERITLFASIVGWLLLIGAIYMEWKNRNKNPVAEKS